MLPLHSRAAPSVEAHHHVNSPDTGRNSGGRCIIFFFKHEFMVKDAEKLQRETILKIFANNKKIF